jgi:hypothetical protein
VTVPQVSFQGIWQDSKGFSLEMVQGHRDHCVVGWQKVCKLHQLGGHGIRNLEVLGWLLNMRWLWFKKTEPDHPWAGLDIQVHSHAAALSAILIQTIIGVVQQHCSGQTGGWRGNP